MAAGRNWPVTIDGPKVKHWEITPSADVLDPRPVGIFITGSGEVTIVDEVDTALPYPVEGSLLLPFSPSKITDADTGVRIYGWL